MYDLLSNKNYKKIHYFGSSVSLCKTLLKFCSDKNITFSVSKLNYIKAKILLKPFLFYQIDALFSFFKFLILRIRIIIKRNLYTFDYSNSIFICSYFFNINSTKLKKGIYNSPYWGNLISYIESKGFSINWLNLFVNYKGGPKIYDVSNKLDKINNESPKFHSLLDNYLNLYNILFVIYYWLIIQFKILRIFNKRKNI